MRQGLFVYCKDFDKVIDVLGKDIRWCLELINIMNNFYPWNDWEENGWYKVVFGYGFGIRWQNLGRMEEFF